MRKKYLPLVICCLILQFSLAQETDRQRVLSNISSLELTSEEDFAVFEDSVNYNKSVLTDEDRVSLYQRAVNQCKQVKNDSLYFYYSALLLYKNVSIREFDKAILAGKECIEQATAIKDTFELISGLLRIGGVYMYQSNLVESYDIYKKALNLAKTYGNKHLVNVVSINLSSCYKTIGREDDAISLIKNSIADYQGLESIDALSVLLAGYSSLAGVELKDSIEEKFVIQELERVTQVAENHSDFEQNKVLQSTSHQAYYYLFNYYTRKKLNLEKMEYYYQKMINSSISNKTTEYLTSFSRAIINKDLAKAKTYLKKENEKIYGGLYNSHALEYYKLTGNFKQQLYFTNLLKDSKIDELKADKVNLYTFTKIQLENSKKAKEVILLQKEMENQQLKQYYHFAITFLLCGILISIFYAFLQIKKRNESLKEKNNIISQQANKLKSINEQKSIFFANVAHEFQTPLSIITGLAKKVKSLEKIEDTKPLLSIIIRNGVQLTQFTNQILDLTKNEESAYAISMNHFYIDQLIKYQIHELQYLADAKNIKIELENKLDRQVIFSDVHKFKTIVKNLLSNAIKFSPLHSMINLELKAIDKKNISIAISDKGKGIPQEDLSIIFDRFYQSENEEGGFGIGLAICKEYTHALGGRIEAQSILGKGSQFSLHIPTNVNGQVIEESLIQKFPIEEHFEESPLVNQNKQNHSILIVEDNPDFCKYLSSVLVNRYQLMFFHNGYDALDYLKSNSPDLIITDWMLPEIDGLEFIKTLKNTLEDKRMPPVLMLTARGMITDQLKVLREGVDDYLVKTFEEEILIQRIEHLLLGSDNGWSNSVSLNENKTSPSYQIVENISKQDQVWLLKFESVVAPKIQDFELNLEEIAVLMNMSVTHLGRKMKTIAGITPKKYIQEMRFWEARRMLELGLVDSVKAACFSVGFKDKSNFSKKFKGKFGIYPSELMV